MEEDHQFYVVCFCMIVPKYTTDEKYADSHEN
jgi:hypothetical protein